MLVLVVLIFSFCVFSVGFWVVVCCISLLMLSWLVGIFGWKFVGRLCRLVIGWLVSLVRVW